MPPNISTPSPSFRFTFDGDDVITPDQIDADWLQEIVRPTHGPTVAVRAVDVSPLGPGQSADSYRIRAELVDGSYRRLVAKFSSRDPESRRMGQETGMYEREVRFYTTIAHEIAVRTPIPLHAAMDPATHAFVLVLEDLAPARCTRPGRG